MIKGVHALIYSKDALADRAFFRDVLGLPYIEAHKDWLIFALPPSELGIHPTTGGDEHELFLMCDDVHATVDDLKAKGAKFSGSIKDRGFGLIITLKLPGGGKIGLYEPKHKTAIRVGAARKGLRKAGSEA